MFMYPSALWFGLTLDKLDKLTKEIVLGKTCFQRGLEFFNILFIQEKVKYQILKVVQNI